jgi:hypothetical protein
MRITEFKAWLQANSKNGSPSDIISHLKRVEAYYPNLDGRFADDHLESLLETLSTDGVRVIKHCIPIDSDEPERVTHSLKSAVKKYLQFCEAKPPIAKSFRHSAGFGKRMEFWIIGEMLRRNFDVYIPLVDDRGVDAIVRRSDGSFVELQIKARSNDVIIGDAALFAAISHEEERKNYFFIFYSARLDKIWVLSSKEFITEAVQNKSGNNKGKRSIWFNGYKTNKETGEREEYAYERFEKYACSDFSRLNENVG